MSYTKLLVHLDMGIDNRSLLKTTSYLAGHFNAGVVGLCACKATPLAYGETYVSGGVIAADEDEMSLEAAAAEAEFRAALLPSTRNLSWLAKPGAISLCDFVVGQAKRADLIVTASGAKSLLDHSRRLDIGDLVLDAGRPVLIIPRSVQVTRLDRVVVGWKDNAASRRAILGAFPVLELATHVTVVEFASQSPQSGIGDVVEWLSGHGVAANAIVRACSGSVPQALMAVAKEEDADLLVCGAYGHSRLGEWVWGGVTQNLLMDPPIACLVSQ